MKRLSAIFLICILTACQAHIPPRQESPPAASVQLEKLNKEQVKNGKIISFDTLVSGVLLGTVIGRNLIDRNLGMAFTTTIVLKPLRWSNKSAGNYHEMVFPNDIFSKIAPKLFYDVIEMRGFLSARKNNVLFSSYTSK
jgi:hypothetical protein